DGTAQAATNVTAISIYDTQTGALLHRSEPQPGAIKRLVWSIDGKWLFAGFAGPGNIAVFNADAQRLFADPFSADVYAIAVSANRLAVAALDGAVRVYDTTPLSEGLPVKVLARLSIGVNAASIAFSPDGKALVIGYARIAAAPRVVRWESGAIEALPEPYDL